MGANMTAMVEQIRALGGEPVLVTSLTRRTFNADGTIDDALGPWAAGTYFCPWLPTSRLIYLSTETALIAQQQVTHLLDLHNASIAYVEAIGPDAAHVLNRTPDDNTRMWPL